MTYQKEAGMPTIRQLYRSGIGPSSSHTIGPERICRTFLEAYPNATRFEVVLFGSLAQTGVGHGTDTVIRKVLAPKPVEIVFNTEETNLPHPNTMDISKLTGEVVAALVLSVILAMPVGQWLKEHICDKWLDTVSYAAAVVLFVLCIMALAAGGFIPFIYAQF